MATALIDNKYHELPADYPKTARAKFRFSEDRVIVKLSMGAVSSPAPDPLSTPGQRKAIVVNTLVALTKAAWLCSRRLRASGKSHDSEPLPWRGMHSSHTLSSLSRPFLICTGGQLRMLSLQKLRHA